MKQKIRTYAQSSNFKRPKIGHREMVWFSKGNNTLVKRMESNHIKNTIQTLNQMRRDSIICSHPVELWLSVFKEELNYRDKWADEIIRRVPTLFDWTCKQLMKDRVFSTKHLM